MKELIVSLFIIAVLGLSISCGVARWNECRRVHPFWYCASNR